MWVAVVLRNCFTWKHAYADMRSAHKHVTQNNGMLFIWRTQHISKIPQHTHMPAIRDTIFCLGTAIHIWHKTILLMVLWLYSNGISLYRDNNLFYGEMNYNYIPTKANLNPQWSQCECFWTEAGFTPRKGDRRLLDHSHMWMAWITVS